MSRLFVSLLVVLLCAGLGRAGETKPAAPWERYRDFDVDGDGTVEIARVEALVAAGTGRRGVLVLVEPRLLDPLAGAHDLRPRLKLLAADLAEEGRRASVLAVTLAPGKTHRDGRLVLALRALLRDVYKSRGLEAALLVGRFPDAMLVRTCNWHKHGKVVLRKGKPDQSVYADTPYLRRVPELVAPRADIVLADLDGAWDTIYVQARTKLPTLMAVYPDGVPKEAGPSADQEVGAVTFEDFFNLDDAGAADHETAEADRARPNPLARPEISVSRIDARGTALRPRRDIVGVDGHHLLDEKGRPQAVRFAKAADVPHWRSGIWEPDPVFERRLLAEFLDRDHAYRTGAAKVALRPASLACGLPSGMRVMRHARKGWEKAGEAADDVHGKPTLAQVVAWFERPALLRTVRAHSDPWGSAFARCPVGSILAPLGDVAPWSWTRKGARLVPSLQAACRGGKLDWFLLRTLYEADAIAPGPAFYHDTGCECVSPPGARRRPYDDPAYGVRQGGEALLFFARGLALVGRAKVFYDEPRGFAQALRDGRSFGEAWRRYFEIESRGPTWKRVGGDIGRKRAYFWSVLGDATLRMP